MIAKEVKEKVKKSYDRCAATYDADTRLQDHLAGMLARAIREDRVKFTRVLDIGCGTGYFIEKAGAGRAFYSGCDISLGMLKAAKNKTPNNYIQADAQELPFADFSFDLVVSSAAYQWVFDLKKAFLEAGRVLRRRGKFYFTVFNKNTLWQLQDACSQTGIVRPASGYFPDKDALLSDLRAVGFNKVSVQVFNYKKYYGDLRQLLGALKKTGAAISEHKAVKGLNWRSVLEKIGDVYIAKFKEQRGLPVTYEAFLVKTEKNNASGGGDTFL